jgi:hypothetical protein
MILTIITTKDIIGSNSVTIEMIDRIILTRKGITKLMILILVRLLMIDLGTRTILIEIIIAILIDLVLTMLVQYMIDSKVLLKKIEHHQGNIRVLTSKGIYNKIEVGINT